MAEKMALAEGRALFGWPTRHHEHELKGWPSDGWCAGVQA